MSLINKIRQHRINRSFKSKRDYLRSVGAKIGNNTRLLCNVESFGTEPYLVSVGDNCLFSGGISIITHDGGISVLNNLNCFDGVKMDKAAPVKIGNNVFVGAKTMILPGVTIGNNVIIGAGSIVSKDIPDNSVAAGIPAKVIKTIDEYREKCLGDGVLYPTAGMSAEEKKKYLLENIQKK